MTALLAIPALLVSAGLAMPPTAPPAGQIPADRGPDIVILDQVPGCYGSVRFDHRLHVGMSNIGDGCKVCHHTEAIETCRTCHDPTSSAVTTESLGLRGAYHRQCLSCHKTWAHENACGFCHTDSSTLAKSTDRLRPMLSRSPLAHETAQPTYVYQTAHTGIPVVTFHHADHAERFGLSCADCHGGNSCAQCHGPGAERPAVSRQQSCYRCHAESKCISCHHLAPRPRFDHAACANWRLRPGHDDLACADCHGKTRMPGRPDPDLCKSCHASQAGGTFNHDDTGVRLYGDHALFTCVDCHAGGDDRQIARCTTCHESQPIRGQRRVGRAVSDSIATPPQ